MTNPDNVGWLPEPVGWRVRLSERGNNPWGPSPWHLESSEPKPSPREFYDVEQLHTADQMRAYGELRRAAPAGGEYPTEADGLALELVSVTEERDFLRRRVAELSAPAGGEPNGKLVGWWNGITPGFDGMGMPSIRWGADAEDSRHDIPLYDGYNPIHYVTPVSASAGGDSLRALVKELRESLEGVVRVADRNTDEFDRAREAIARSSHVFVNAGDSEAQFIADGENLDCPACGGSGHAGDSASAGSGEVERLKEVIDHYERGLISTPYTRAIVDQVRAREMAYHLEVVRLNRVVARQSAKIKRIAALLRKLQQGAE